ncbi:SDR family NAD(P)-dependent oxidoreductase [Marasmitruncus massiliensis]|uniref:SDR family NAD(P)-dependent oxidoreductase n=1 Tax=Marasmitruncus massiliensis TaxID=1944642 RepID=UPI000C7E7FB4|nr:glucose 1-dehydrogenase [Marasmitruncus massiliensis]
MQDLFLHAFSLEDRTAVITGGGTGLGYAMSKCMIAAGARIVMLGRREDVLRKACTELGERASYLTFDITDTDNMEKIVRKIRSDVGRIYILVNNAGNQHKKPVEEMTVNEFTQVLDVHLVGSFALTKAILPSMREQKKGSVIFISSMSGFIGNSNLTGYAAAKSGILGLVRTLASEVSGNGVRVNAIAPGWLETPMFLQALAKDPDRQARILQRTPMNKFGNTTDVGWAAVYLASDASSFVTGTSITVDGGAVIGL